MKMKSVIVTVSTGTLRGTFQPSDDPQDVPADIADEMLALGRAMSPGEAKAASKPKTERTTSRGRTKKETTAK